MRPSTMNAAANHCWRLCITVGGTASVPEPAGGALAALALGAVGLRRKRKN